jgi:hypothetical protein
MQCGLPVCHGSSATFGTLMLSGSNPSHTAKHLSFFALLALMMPRQQQLLDS